MKILVDKAAIEQALEALVVAEEFVDRHSEDWYISGQQDLKQIREAITALREALAEQAEQEQVYKALRVAEEALVYHTEQTRPIQKTDEAIIYLRNMMAQGVLNMAFTLEDAMAKYPEISYWYNEFIKHNTTAEQAEQEPVAIDWDKAHEVLCDVWNRVISADDGFDALQDLIYAAPVRTKDLTDDEIEKAFWGNGDTEIEGCRAVIAADREKNK